LSEASLTLLDILKATNKKSNMRVSFLFASLFFGQAKKNEDYNCFATLLENSRKKNSGESLAYQDSISGSFNDPYDFFDFIKLRSAATIQNDGYGVVYYPHNTSLINDTHRWYKTGLGVWYGDGNAEPMDKAIPTIMNPENNAKIVLAHARGGTGGEGSHPFWLEIDNKTYTFMHNGAISGGVKAAMMNYLGKTWYQEHTSNWFGEFPFANTFIDSEILFHYLLSFIITEKSVVAGIERALHISEMGSYNIQEIVFSGQSIINFVLSDGEKVYIFRNSGIQSGAKLSYDIIDNRFIGVKTGSTIGTDILPYTLTEISSEQVVVHDLQQPDVPAEIPFSAKIVNETILLSFLSNSSEVLGWNFYRSKEANDFHLAWKLNPHMISANMGEMILFYDDLPLQNGAIYYYWLERIDFSGESALHSSISIRFILLENTILTNYPNPFQHSTTIQFSSDLFDQNEPITFEIYNLKGQRIKHFKMHNEKWKMNEVVWDGKDENDKKVSAGIYFYRLKTNHSSVNGRMLLLKE
jgi:hypothetical protein